MLEFRVHESIVLKLEENKTIIYVAGEKFRQCNKLILEIPVDNPTYLDEIQSIDEVVEKQRNDIVEMKYTIPPETEFWGHCSNLQTWVESGYDTRLLHSELELIKETQFSVVDTYKRDTLNKNKLEKKTHLL